MELRDKLQRANVERVELKKLLEAKDRELLKSRQRQSEMEEEVAKGERRNQELVARAIVIHFLSIRAALEHAKVLGELQQVRRASDDS